jgi:hypothetical protein
MEQMAAGRGEVRKNLARALAAVGLGSGLALAWGAVSIRGPEPARPARWVVADRDRGELVALDRDLLVVRRTPVELPVEIESRADRTLWVASASPLGPLADGRLRCLALDGSVIVERSIGPLFDLDVIDSADALVVDAPGGARRAARLRVDGTWSIVEVAPDLACIAGQSGEVLVGTEGGELRLHAGGATYQRSFGGWIADVAPGPRSGSWWVLDAHGGPSSRRVALLGPALATVWERPAGLAALHLAPVRGAEQVWLADPSSNLARRFGRGGALEVPQAQLAMVGADRGCGRENGSVLFATPGAVLALDALGGAASGQGGFDFLVDVADLEAR